MRIKAVISDIYTTLIDIRTDETNKDVYRRLASYLKYQGVYLSADELKWFFFEKKALQKKIGKEEYPEVDYRRIWGEILKENRYKPHGHDTDGSDMAEDVVRLHRSLSVEKIKLYHGVYAMLDHLKHHYRLGIISDSQPDHSYPELRMLGIYGYFDAVVVSGEFGYRKPDVRLFKECLKRLGAEPHESVYVGNSIFRDVKGAKEAGMTAILIESRHTASEDGVSPDYTIDRIDRLEDVLRGLEKK